MMNLYNDGLFNIDPFYAEPGKWYYHRKFGTVLCAGTPNRDRYLPSFVYHGPRGASKIVRLNSNKKNFLSSACVQNWPEIK